MVGATNSTGVSRLGGLAKTSLREQALDVLRNAVTSGEIAPGTHLVETELSAALSISRGTLREAMRQLEQEGLVEPSERGRLRVRTLNTAEIEEMFLVRSALEGLAASLLCRLDDRTTVVRKLQEALDALAAATGSINDMVEIDLDFHRTLCSLTGNTALVRSWERHRRRHPDVDHVRRVRTCNGQHVGPPPPGTGRRRRRRRSGPGPHRRRGPHARCRREPRDPDRQHGTAQRLIGRRRDPDRDRSSSSCRSPRTAERTVSRTPQS